MKESVDHSYPVGPTKIPSENTPKEVQQGAWEDLSRSDLYHVSSHTGFFSRSLPVPLHENLNLSGADGFKKSHQDVDGNGLLEDADTCVIGTMLPDDEEDLLADFDLSGLPNSLEDLEEYDVFGSGGGMELEADPQESLNVGLSKLSFSDGHAANGLPYNSFLNGVGIVAGEHPYGEHPSRTLFVRNINNNVEDSELRALFEQYGHIRTLYTACKHRGFVMVSYYDIRAARTAMHALQNKPLRRRKLDIHFSIPKDNPSDKDINQGTLVVFNLDPSVSNEDLRTIFGAYGEVKEIRETSQKGHHKFIEFYDVRAAEAALKSLNRSNIAGRRIKVELSRPGGTRRNLVLQTNQELDHDEKLSFRHQMGSPVANSPPGYWLRFNSTVENNSFQTISDSPGSGIMSPSIGNHLPGLASVLHPPLSNAMKGVAIGKDLAGSQHAEHIFASSNSSHGETFQSHSLPEPKFIPYSGALSSFGSSPSNGSSVETLSGSQFLWGSPNLYSQDIKPSAWPTPSVRHSFTANGNSHAFQNPAQESSFIGLSQNRHHNHVGSAPSGFPFERNFGVLSKSPETSFVNHVGYGGIGLGHSKGNYMVNMGESVNAGITIPRNMSEHGSPNIGMRSSPRLSLVFSGNGPYPGLPPTTTTTTTTTTSVFGFVDPGRNRRIENNGGQADSSKKQFHLDLDRIKNSEDRRTTLMIKNIPNKYTSKMLLAAIDEKHKGTYDFFYLPIDFKNKCNVGYAFINMLSASHIIPFYETFNGKKWEKFNSEKVASLAYARIQGKAALVNHFQNSSLMNEDERCRPVVFHSQDPEGGDKIIQDHTSDSTSETK
ncbi:protein MEI2-like 3 isoform X1 [Arachis stenosperma]|uniref:protein MEI2-like 3 isoform X1 n=1 Tax=Arachis stenosperma TaxID=217475 RepID=UPI0025ABF5CD|nr:protein MEI2-like 3 isoform X1 [Arachis stenosperma]